MERRAGRKPGLDGTMVEIWYNGKRIYGNLIDDGSNVMRFASGWGFIAKDQCVKNGWEVRTL
jgi:hypothetical protein